MFGTRRRVSEPQLLFDPERAAAAADNRALTAALEALAAGRFGDATLTAHPAGASLERLVEALARQGRMTLVALAAVGQETAEAGTIIGWLYNDVRDVVDDSAVIATSVGDLAGSIAELSTSSETSVDSAIKVRDDTEACVADMRGAGESMGLIGARVAGMNARMAVLEAAVTQISDMAATIEKISSQTNLLALNATIEAVRAGEAGRGFAVVASEVKSLSGQTAKATEEIRTRLSTLTSEMDGIKDAMRESSESIAPGEAAVKAAEQRIVGIGQQMSTITERMTALAAVINQQRSATNEISSRATKIAAKAQKARGEFDGLLGRLLNAETGAADVIQNFSVGNTAICELLRAKADLTIWKRKLAAALVRLAKPDSALIDRSVRRLLGWCDTVTDDGIRRQPAFQAIRSAEAAVFTEGQRCLEAIQRANWKAATEAYLAVEKAIEELFAQADRLIAAIDRETSCSAPATLAHPVAGR
jgi:methyl-accepting chemotaxis protein